MAVGYGDPAAPRPAVKNPDTLYKDKACRAFYSEDDGLTWKSSKASEGKGCLRGLAVAKDRALLAVGDKGVILRSEDRGASWQAVKSPTTEDLRTVTWCGPLAVAAGKKGTVVCSKDDGKTWDHTPVPLTVSLVAVVPAESHVVILGEMGIILRCDVAKLAGPK